VGNLRHVGKDVLSRVRVVWGDITDTRFLAELFKGSDVVFHLAALIAIPYSYRSPFSYVHTNVHGTLAMLQACKDVGVQKILHTSTSECYGTAVYTPIDERHPLQGQSPYSASKIGADKLAESFHLSFGLPVVTVRPFNTFGPRQSARAVVPTILSQLLAKCDRLMLGSVTPVRDLTFVKDTIAGFIALAKCDSAIGKVVNVGTGVGHTVKEVAAEAMAQCGHHVEILSDEQRVRPEKSEVHKLICDARQMKDLTGWSPRYTLGEGIALTKEFIAQNPDAYRPEEYTI